MACDHLMAEGVVRLGVTTIERAVVSARGRAWTETFRRLEPQLTPERRRNLDGLLAVDPDRAMSPLAWFRRLPADRSSAQIRELVQVKQQLIDVGADCFDVSMLNPNRVRHLAALGRRMDAQALARMAPERRYPILVATAVERRIATSDLVLDLFDTAVGAIDRKARRDRDEQPKAHVVAASDTVSMFARVARILLDPEIPDYRVRHAVWDEVGRDRLVETAQRADQIEANTVGSYLELVTGQYRRARKFAPAVLGAFDFYFLDSPRGRARVGSSSLPGPGSGALLLPGLPTRARTRGVIFFTRSGPGSGAREKGWLSRLRAYWRYGSARELH